MRNPQAESSARAVLPEEIRVKDAWGKGKKIERKKKKEGEKKERKNKENSLFLKRGLHCVWFKKPLKVIGFRARLRKARIQWAKEDLFLYYLTFIALLKQASLVSL